MADLKDVEIARVGEWKLASGPLTTPAFGVERFEWDPMSHAWCRVWTRPDLASISQVPVVAGG